MEFFCRGHQVAQRVIGMRIVHDDQERLPRIDSLEAARHGSKLGDSGSDDFSPQTERHAGANGRKNIVDVDSPDQR